MHRLLFTLSMLASTMGCRMDGDHDTAAACEAQCPIIESTYVESDVPCSEAGSTNPEGVCKVIEECGEIIYCRTEGV